MSCGPSQMRCSGKDISEQSLIDENACKFKTLERDYSGGTYE